MESNVAKKKTTKKKTTKKKVAAVSVESKDDLKKVERLIYSLEGKFLHIKVGDQVKPATDDDIGDIEQKFNDLLEKHEINALAFVTHHAVDICVYGSEK